MKTGSTYPRKTGNLVYISIFTALIIVMGTVPFLGYIPLGVIRATTVHIPVILGSILLGPKAGAVLGGVFGLTSFLTNTFTPVSYTHLVVISMLLVHLMIWNK